MREVIYISGDGFGEGEGKRGRGRKIEMDLGNPLHFGIFFCPIGEEAKHIPHHGGNTLLFTANTFPFPLSKNQTEDFSAQKHINHPLPPPPATPGSFISVPVPVPLFYNSYSPRKKKKSGNFD